MEAECILDEQVHKRLIADIATVAEVANVPINMIKQSAKSFLGPVALGWVKNYHLHREKGEGLLLSGVQSIAPEVQCMAMGGALLRNFIDARVMPLNQFVGQKEDDALPTVVLIPNLYVKSSGKALTSWQQQVVYDGLLRRLVAGKLTVAYVEDIEGLRQEYGKVFAQHLISNYIVG